MYLLFSKTPTELNWTITVSSKKETPREFFESKLPLLLFIFMSVCSYPKTERHFWVGKLYSLLVSGEIGAKGKPDHENVRGKEMESIMALKMITSSK